MNRTSKKAVWLTSTERDMVASGLQFLLDELVRCAGNKTNEWAGSYTRRRIIETRALFLDATSEKKE